MNPARKLIIGSVMAGTAMLGGAVGATLFGTANAQTAPTSSTTATTAPATSTAPTADNDGDGHGGGPHQANGITETVLTGDQATKATAAAEAAVPGATAERAETDAEGAAFEVHMTKADGSDVTVKLDSSFKVTETLDGHG